MTRRIAWLIEEEGVGPERILGVTFSRAAARELRERLNAEVLRIWRQTRTTVIFVTHSIPEAVFLSTRVVVMSPRPGRITNVIDIDMPQPRNDQTRETERYFELITEVRESLRGRRASGASRPGGDSEVSGDSDVGRESEVRGESEHAEESVPSAPSEDRVRAEGGIG